MDSIKSEKSLTLKKLKDENCKQVEVIESGSIFFGIFGIHQYRYQCDFNKAYTLTSDFNKELTDLSNKKANDMFNKSYSGEPAELNNFGLKTPIDYAMYGIAKLYSSNRNVNISKEDGVEYTNVTLDLINANCSVKLIKRSEYEKLNSISPNGFVVPSNEPKPEYLFKEIACTK